MNDVIIANLISEKISGEWGVEPTNGSSIKILRTTNFTNIGRLNLESIVERQIDGDIVDRKRLKYGDTIIEKSGGSPKQPVGRVVFYDIKSTELYLCNNFTAILRPSSKVDPKYFFFALFFKHLSQGTLKYQNKTTGILNLKLERYLSEESIPLPDLKTQKKIAWILEQADTALEKRRQVNKLCEQFIQSLFSTMFGDPLKNDLGWKQERLIDCVEIKGGGTPSKSKPEYFMGNIPWVSPKDMKSRFIYTSQDKITQKAVEESSTNLIPVNSVLVVVRSGILKNTLPIAVNKVEVTINQDMKAFISNKKIESIFLLFQLRALTSHILQFVRATTADNISSDIFKSINLILPPVSKQLEFVKYVDQVETLRKKQKESEIELENLFLSLMQKYLS